MAKGKPTLKEKAGSAPKTDTVSKKAGSPLTNNNTQIDNTVNDDYMTVISNYKSKDVNKNIMKHLQLNLTEEDICNFCFNIYSNITQSPPYKFEFDYFKEKAGYNSGKKIRLLNCEREMYIFVIFSKEINTKLTFNSKDGYEFSNENSDKDIIKNFLESFNLILFDDIFSIGNKEVNIPEFTSYHNSHNYVDDGKEYIDIKLAICYDLKDYSITIYDDFLNEAKEENDYRKFTTLDDEGEEYMDEDDDDPD